MKNIKLWKAFLFIMAVIAAFTSCKESADVGMELLPSSDLIVVRNATMKDEIRAYTFTDDSVEAMSLQTACWAAFMIRFSAKLPLTWPCSFGWPHSQVLASTP